MQFINALVWQAWLRVL